MSRTPRAEAGPDPTADSRGISERGLIVVLGAVQLVNVLDFMMVMPLGPDFALALGIPTSHLGIIAGAYTASAAVAGLVGLFFLDRFDRKRALLVALLGLFFGTLAGGVAVGLGTLVAARVVAGAFGGPATSLALAIVADAIPPERRGRVLGTIMGAFAIASVLGVPAGLELARLGSWRTPFFAVASLGLLVLLAAWRFLPSFSGHLATRRPVTLASTLEVVRRPVVGLSLAANGAVTMSVFAIVPNIAAFLQFNAGYPREHLGLLYFVGGAFSFFTLRIAGRMADRHGAAPVTIGGTLLFGAVLGVGFIPEVPALPILAVFAAFMISGSFRMVPMNALSTRVPRSDERARYMSMQSAVQHASSAAGAALSSVILTELPGGKLAGMSSVAELSLALAAVLPFLVWAVEARVRASEAQQPSLAA